MPSAADLNAVLAHIDADIDNSLERLFALLRIKSISTDPAFAADCKAAAEHLAKDFASLGFAADVRPTGGHPAVVGKSNGSGPRVMFYGHYDVQPVDPLNEWTELCHQVSWHVAEVVVSAGIQDRDDREPGRLGQRRDEPPLVAPDCVGRALLAAPAVGGVLASARPVRLRRRRQWSRPDVALEGEHVPFANGRHR